MTKHDLEVIAVNFKLIDFELNNNQDVPVGHHRISKELMKTENKQIIAEMTPLSALMQLKQKHETDIVINIQDEHKLNDWSCQIKFGAYFKGKGIANSKQNARHFAAIDIFSQLFPCMSWEQLQKHIHTQKKPL